MTSRTLDGRQAPERRRPAIARLRPALAALLWLPLGHQVADATEIRTHAGNRVPACVTPERLMAFLSSRNGGLDPRLKGVAGHYRRHGEAWSVRWDYAFYQMLVETNYLTFRRGDGSPGDVSIAQNNFAGLGTTGGGVAGDSFPDVSTGVLAQIQHLVAYSGERLAAPVGPRTRLKQDDIVAASRGLGRPVRFADLSRRWATDPGYGRSIELTAERYKEAHCSGQSGGSAEATPGPASREIRNALGGEPSLLRAPRPAERQARRDTSGAVRTVWSAEDRGSAPPPIAQETLAPAPRRPAAVAAGAATAQSVMLDRPITAAEPGTAIEALEIARRSLAVTADLRSGTTIGADPTPAPADDPPIAFSAAAAPFAAGPTVVEAEAAAGTCRVVMASYGGSRTVLIKSVTGGSVELVVLSVIPGFEAAMSRNYINIRAPGGVVEGEFANRDDALVRAREICTVSS